MLEKHKVSISAQLRSWLRPRIEGMDKADIIEELPYAVDDLSRDEEFVKQFLAEELLPHLLGQARAIMAEGRNRVVLSGTTVQTQDAFDNESKDREARFNPNVWVHAAGEYIRLPKMTKPLLEAAVRESAPRQRTERIRRRAQLMLMAALPDDSITVGEFFTPDQVQELYKNAELEVGTEMEMEEMQYG